MLNTGFEPYTYSYSQLRRTVQSGDVMLVQGNLAIRVLTASSYSHVALCVWIEEGLWIAEMKEGKGYQLQPASNWLAAQTKTIWLGAAPDMDRSKILPFVLHTRGVMPTYGWRTLPRVWISRLSGKRLLPRNPVCSTLVQDGWEVAGYTKFDELASPEEIMQHCKGLLPISPFQPQVPVHGFQ